MLIPITSGLAVPRSTLAATYDVQDSVVSPANASATFTLESDGDVAQTISAGTTDLGDWISPKSAAGSNYECNATLDSGTLASGTTGSWLSLGSNRAWTVTRVAIGSSVAQITIQIRNAGTLAVLGSTIVTITADKS